MADQPEPKKVAPTLLGRKRQKNGVVLGDHRPQLENISRRLFFRQGLSLGALAMLSGCNLQDDTAVDKVLWPAI
ncbi:hypothetical protein [Rhizobium laguerreae]|uniref:hypothetical protein n=1 Tax=Rhizobium laguerreae TaxID=1076926 RepID=UPI001FE013BD|nr:hypothetical protein [Rhizobium laguerreae]